MSDNISVFEEYLFAQDKAQFLESCKNASDIKKYIRICHLLSRSDAKLEKHDLDVLENWKLYCSYQDKGDLVVKHQLQQIFKEEDVSRRQQLMKEFNDKYLFFAFNDHRQTAGNQAQTLEEGGEAQPLKTELTKEDHDEMLTATKINELINSESGHLSFNLNELGPSILGSLDFSSIKSWSVKECLLGTLTRFSSSQVSNYYLEYRADPGGLQRVQEKHRQESLCLANPRVLAQ